MEGRHLRFNEGGRRRKPAAFFAVGVAPGQPGSSGRVHRGGDGASVGFLSAVEYKLVDLKELAAKTKLMSDDMSLSP